MIIASNNVGMAVANSVGLVAVLIANALFGWRLGAISARHDTAFTPDRRAFAIWSLIYPLLIATMVAQFFDQDTCRALDVAFLVHCAGTIAWLYMFTSTYVRTASIFLLITTAAIGVCYGRVQQWRTMDSWPVAIASLTFSIFFGWSLLASVLNLSITFDISPKMRIPVWSLLFCSVLPVQLVTLDPLLSLPIAWGAARRAVRDDSIAHVFSILFLACSVGVGAALVASRV